MTAATMTPASAELSAQEVRRLCGDVLDWKVEAILETRGTVAELEKALAWAGGVDEAFGERPHPLAGAAAQIYDILMADEPIEDDRDR